MRDNAPIRESIANGFTPEWVRWLQKITLGLSGWNRSLTQTAVINFAAVGANAESTASTVTVTGARQGDAVQVQPLGYVGGIIYKGAVTADDTVSVYACNFTTASIDPASTTFRIIVLQN